MPLFVIERNFAEQLEVTRTGADEIEAINNDVGVEWLFSFLSADKKKTYCLYEAPSPEAIREAGRAGGHTGRRDRRGLGDQARAHFVTTRRGL